MIPELLFIVFGMGIGGTMCLVGAGLHNNILLYAGCGLLICTTLALIVFKEIQRGRGNNE